MEDTFVKFIEEFTEEVVSEMNFENMNDEQKQELRNLISARVDKNIMGVMLENLPEKEFKKLTDILDKGDWTEEEQHAIFTEAAKKVPDFETKLAEMFFKLKKELVEDAEELKNL
jgi:hypothetical protein